MIHITLPDGSIKSYEQNITSYEVALSISEGLARNVLAAIVNDEVWIYIVLFNRMQRFVY